MRNEAETAREIVREAGILAANLQWGIGVREKAGGLGPVTEADLAVEKLILDRLEAAFPDDAILSEESRSSVDEERRRIWCVDPIDGTREYADGSGEYAVQVGLLVKGEPQVGALSLPGEGLVIWGWREGGVFVQQGEQARERELRLEPPRDLSRAVAIHSRSHAGPRLEEALARLGVARAIPAGSVGYKVAQILMGRAQVYYHPGRGTTWWDTAAPIALLLAAGGEVSDARGGPFRYGPGLGHRQGMLLCVPGLLEPATRLLKWE